MKQETCTLSFFLLLNILIFYSAKAKLCATLLNKHCFVLSSTFFPLRTILESMSAATYQIFNIIQFLSIKPKNNLLQ